MKTGAKILSIDVGVKNFCYCFFDADSQNILEWTRLSLPPKGNTLLIPRLVKFLHDFEHLNQAMISSATHIAVEQQMTSSMRIMEAVLFSQYYGRAFSVNPRRVKKYWREQHPEECPVRTSTSPTTKSIEYRLGKRLAVSVAKNQVLPKMDAKWLDFFLKCPKKDDYADSLLQAVYVARTLSEKQ